MNIILLVATVCVIISLLVFVLFVYSKGSSTTNNSLSINTNTLLCPLVFDLPSKVPVPVSYDMEDQNYNANLALQLSYFHELLYHLFCNNRLLASSSETSLLNTFNSYMTSPFRVVKVLYSTAPTLLSKETQVAGFIGNLTRNNITYTFVILRATCTAAEYYNDAKINLIRPTWASSSSGIKVHNGFNIIYTTPGTFLSLREQLMNYLSSNNITNLIISGHSLGGCLSGIFLCDLILQNKNIVDKTKTYLFGTPYTGNSYFADKIRSKTIINSKYKLYNLINNEDKAPTLRLGSEYARLVPQTFCFSTKSDISNHLVRLYRDAIIKYKTTWNSCNNEQCGLVCM
jgi:hypothetical protein